MESVVAPALAWESVWELARKCAWGLVLEPLWAKAYPQGPVSEPASRLEWISVA